MSERVKVVYEGETVEAEEVSFASSGSFLVCDIEDGARIEVTHGIKTVYRLCDKKKDDGSPIYILMGTAAVKQVPPPKKMVSA